MLFNSIPFLFCFLPAVLLGFFLFSRLSPTWASAWLVVSSLFFYAWWNASFLVLLLCSVLFNYFSGRTIQRAHVREAPKNAKYLACAAIAIDILVLAYFKYGGFLTANLVSAVGTKADLGDVLLPLGISFFTFTQIAFLADVYSRKSHEFNFLRYLLFVTYFPHLIAGPILHHAQMMPQFSRKETYRLNPIHLAVGLTIFAIGLSKKLLFADPLGVIASPVFASARAGATPALFDAWAAALAYSLQLYFDFSGYCDMAIGVSLLFNVKLPLNFNSPYKSANIIDFWRRWHMTLSRFLRDYLYFPLGGNRKGRFRRYVNLLITMLLGGFWHGAGWTFVAWGALHGTFLIANHAFIALSKKMGWSRGRLGRTGIVLSTLTTFCAVTIAWVVFRADSLQAASLMFSGMLGHGGLFHDRLFQAVPESAKFILSRLSLGLLVVWVFPNTQEILRLYAPTADIVEEPRNWTARLAWSASNPLYWLGIGALFALSLLAVSPVHESPFLYYQF